MTQDTQTQAPPCYEKTRIFITGSWVKGLLSSWTPSGATARSSSSDAPSTSATVRARSRGVTSRQFCTPPEARHYPPTRSPASASTRRRRSSSSLRASPPRCSKTRSMQTPSTSSCSRS